MAKLIKLERKCPFCKSKTVLENIDADTYSAYESGLNIAVAFPELKAHEREVIISGCCYKCQEKLYNMPIVSDPATFGKFLGKCPVCDCRVYEKDKSDAGDNLYTCKCCYAPLKLENDVLKEAFEDGDYVEE